MARRKHTPPPSMTFAGMEGHVQAQDAAAGEYQAEELTAKLLEPLGDVSSRAGQLETESPLFYGKVHATLFDS